MENLKHDLISQLFYEAQAYQRISDIEKLVENGMDLSSIPTQPLFMALKSTTKDQVAAILPKLSEEQRTAFLDIDLWTKDEFDHITSRYWLEVYALTKDDQVRFEYVQREEFLLTLKSQLNISTFDVEDPQYPDHDNYFLTEDNLLLIEFDEDFAPVQEVKNLIKQLYYELGVENAYAFLFKMVSDSFSILEEQIYQEKCQRLLDIGFVDYYQALEWTFPFASEEKLEEFIKNFKGKTGHLEDSMKNQALHVSALQGYQSGLSDIKEALRAIKNQDRKDFLQFNFIKLVNARSSVDQTLKSPSTSMTLSAQSTRQRLELGFDYLLNRFNIPGADLLEKFDFQIIYRVGVTLLELEKKSLKATLKKNLFDQSHMDWFLGTYWNQFLDSSLDDVVKFKQDGSSKPEDVSRVDVYYAWKNWGNTLKLLCPFVLKFKKTFDHIVEEQKIQDTFYLNYKITEIDFETLILSSFCLHSLGLFAIEQRPRIGLKLDELKKFYTKFFIKKQDEYLIKSYEDHALNETLQSFQKQFGFEEVARFDQYLYQILVEQMNGYEIDQMDREDFKHVGGPILLAAD